MRRPGIPRLALLVLVLSTPARSEASDDATQRGIPRIVNGVVTTDYPATGALLYGRSTKSATLLCSGTLIGCETFLTAAHCVCETNGANCQGAGSPDPSGLYVFLQHAGFFDVASITVHPDYAMTTDGAGDLAVLKLARPASGIPPARLNITSAPSAGTTGTIVGFGTEGGLTNVGAGLKRSGSVTTASCPRGISNTTSVCWTFKDPIGTPGSNSNTCYGDSGGPLFIDFGAGPVVAGVTTGGTRSACLPTDISYDANVFQYRDWIQAQAGADLGNTTCGSIAQVGDTDASVTGISSRLDLNAASRIHIVDVPSGKSLLRVALNGIDNNGVNFDLYVRTGDTPSTTNYDCRTKGPGQYAFCEFHAPVNGTWQVLVKRVSGLGMYQLTVTAFGTDCSDTANEGAACDDGNPCTDNDTCQAGLCSGVATPPVEGCLQRFIPGKGVLFLRDAPADEDDKLSWGWTRGTATSKLDFGDPLRATDYSLCVYDNSSGTPALLMGKSLPAGGICQGKPCWSEGAKGFTYSDPKLNNGGLKTVVLKQGSDGEAKISVKGQGSKLGMPPVLDQASAVTVQLSNGGMCWESHFTTDATARNGRFQGIPQ